MTYSIKIILLTSQMLTNFVGWDEKLKIDGEENGIEVLESIYAVYISRLEIKAQIFPLDGADKSR